VAAGLAEEIAGVEARCEELARRNQFIHEAGIQVLPSGEAVGRYGFVHALYRHVLYERVPASRRLHLHRRIGEQGEQLYRERTGDIAAELAMHFERAADYRQAATYLQQAAETAIRRFAYHETVALSRRGLDLLARVPDTADRAQQELRLQLTLGVSLIATEGYAAPSVGIVYLQARQLCQRLGDGDAPEISRVLWGLWTFHTLRADLGAALDIAKEFLRLAERRPDSDLAMRGHWAIGITCTHLGECALTMAHFEQALLLYEPAPHGDDAFLYAPNPGVAIRCFAAWALWFLGQPDHALERIHDALRWARELSEPHSLAHALLFAAILHQLRRESRLAQQHAEAAIVVSTEHGLVLYQAMATITRGWTLIDRGSGEDAIEEMRRGLAALQVTGAQLLRPHFLALLAGALAKVGRDDEGLRVLDEALTTAQSTGEGYYLAELHRLKGEQLLGQSTRRAVLPAADDGTAVIETVVETEIETEPTAVAAAEGCFNESLRIARQQTARSLELRAATSLARLCQRQGKPLAALGLLTQACRPFTEGFDTVDWREAQALIKELS